MKYFRKPNHIQIITAQTVCINFGMHMAILDIKTHQYMETEDITNSMSYHSLTSNISERYGSIRHRKRIISLVIWKKYTSTLS